MHSGPRVFNPMSIPGRSNGVKACLWGAISAFAMSRKAGAMLIGGGIAMLAMVTAGGMLTNYAWREAQEEEVQAALRAGVAAASHFLRGGPTANEDAIKERIAGVLRGLLDELTIDKDDIVVEHDLATNRTTIRIAGDARYAFKNLWAGGRAVDDEPLRDQVVVEFEQRQFEFALALDVSPSMGQTPRGWSKTRLKALQDAVSTIAQTVGELSTTNPGLIAVSLVPYSNVVNVADTSGEEKTEAKERYVRMLTGANYDSQTSRDTTGHWVDTFHSYGTGDDMGALASRDLPDFLSATDWNLHKTGTEDISAQRPGAGTWSFRGQDFWNGCVMARWGAYWDSSARPTIWDPTDTSNWPAEKDIAGWAPGSASIEDLPLHLSDAPPDADDPNTRFTAYSWPDANIHGTADGYLDQVLRRTLTPSYNPSASHLPRSENHWHLHLHDHGGSLLCPAASVVPLTDDLETLQTANSYQTAPVHSKTGGGQTFLHLGIVWALRTLSPLWRDVWDTQSVSGEALPRTPCASGGTTTGCSPSVQKAIVIISDGQNWFTLPRLGRSFGSYERGEPVTANPAHHGRSAALCDGVITSGNYPDLSSANSYTTAMSAETPATFANDFDVDQDGKFSGTGLSTVLDGFQAFHPTTKDLDSTQLADRLTINAYRAQWDNALEDMTPWQLFRGYDTDLPTTDEHGMPITQADATDVLMTASNLFDFEGRPVRNRHFCRPHTKFSAYGRVDELVRIGDGPPVDDVAPFSLPSATGLKLNTGRFYKRHIDTRLDDWFLQACDLAATRRVRIHAIYIGTRIRPSDLTAISLLEQCIDRGYGGRSGVDEVRVVPTAQALEDAIENIVNVRRTLRFVQP